MCCKKQLQKVLTPVEFTSNVVGPSYNMSDDVQLKRLPVFGLCSKQFIQLLEPLHTEEASRASLQRDYGGAVSVRAGNMKVVVPLYLPLGSIGDVCLEWHSQFNQVDGGGTLNKNVWALVSG